MSGHEHEECQCVFSLFLSRSCCIFPLFLSRNCVSLFLSKNCVLLNLSKNCVLCHMFFRFRKACVFLLIRNSDAFTKTAVFITLFLFVSFEKRRFHDQIVFFFLKRKYLYLRQVEIDRRTGRVTSVIKLTHRGCRSHTVFSSISLG